MSRQNSVTREGIVVGLIGATAIAAWFAIIDAVQGHLFATPVMLGTSLSSLVLNGATPSTTAALLGLSRERRLRRNARVRAGSARSRARRRA